VTRVYYAFDTRADALLIGCILGVLGAWGKLPASRRAASTLRAISIPLIIGLAVAVNLLQSQSSNYFYSLTFIAGGIAVMLLAVLASPNTRLTSALSFAPLAWCGRVSYGLYLWHYPVARAVEPLGLPRIPAFLLGVGLTFTITTFSFYFLEKPFLRLKRRFASA
jgi:peptidoglycan/LPS O-acetylase OafA/YrhL